MARQTGRLQIVAMIASTRLDLIINMVSEKTWGGLSIRVYANLHTLRIFDQPIKLQHNRSGPSNLSIICITLQRVDILPNNNLLFFFHFFVAALVVSKRHPPPPLT